MYFIYSLLLTVGFLVLLPRFAIDAFRTRKYVTGLRERLGHIPKLSDSDQPLIWLHCVSVGETEAARPLVRALGERFPSHRFVISTTTVSGQHVARRAFAKEAAAIFYFPIDWTWTVRRVLRKLNPSALLIMETELWPNLLRECRHQSIPVALINGRISKTSFKRYAWIRAFMRTVLGNVSVAIMQSEDDAKRISALGLSNDRIAMVGNLKFDSSVSSGADEVLASEFRTRFGFRSNEPLIVAASTHAPEENLVIDAFMTVRQTEAGRAVRLLIAPRHPERFDEVAKLLAASGMAWCRRSALPTTNEMTAAVILLDSVGELRASFQCAQIAFVGGSLIPHGGQNVLEPAAQGVCVITGAFTHNFAAITRALLAEDALIQLPPVSVADAPAALASSLTQLLRDESGRTAIGERARAVCARNRGATQRTIDLITGLLNEGVPTGDRVPFSVPNLSVAK